MQINVSLIFNVLLLIGVIIAITSIIKSRRQNLNFVDYQPPIGTSSTMSQDDIIAVRKIDSVVDMEQPAIQPTIQPPLRPSPQALRPSVSAYQEERRPLLGGESPTSVMMFLLAKENRQLAGYELLQTVLSVGLRFGEGHLFHRHQSPNGQGPILCSLAAATATGVFDLQNIGAFSVHGLCLFMQASGNSTIDAERFAIMLDTAKQLSEGLDTYLLDDQRKPLSEVSLNRYSRALNLDEAIEQLL